MVACFSAGGAVIAAVDFLEQAVTVRKKNPKSENIMFFIKKLNWYRFDWNGF